jgi:hypothetical protein
VIESQSRHIEKPRSTTWDTWAEANISARPRLYLPAASIATPWLFLLSLSMKTEDLQCLERAERMMWRWMCGIRLADRRPSLLLNWVRVWIWICRQSTWQTEMVWPSGEQPASQLASACYWRRNDVPGQVKSRQGQRVLGFCLPNVWGWFCCGKEGKGRPMKTWEVVMHDLDQLGMRRDQHWIGRSGEDLLGENVQPMQSADKAT